MLTTTKPCIRHLLEVISWPGDLDLYFLALHQRPPGILGIWGEWLLFSGSWGALVIIFMDLGSNLIVLVDLGSHVKKN